MSAQNSYESGLKKGYAGQLADIGWNDVVTGTVVAAGSDVKPSNAVSVETTSEKDRIVALGVASVNQFAGLAVRDLADEVVAGNIVYQEKDSLPILQSGHMYCVIPTGGNASNKLKVNATTGVVDVGVAGPGEFQLDGNLEEVTAAGEVGLIHLRSLTVVAGS